MRLPKIGDVVQVKEEYMTNDRHLGIVVAIHDFSDLAIAEYMYERIVYGVRFDDGSTYRYLVTEITIK